MIVSDRPCAAVTTAGVCNGNNDNLRFLHHHLLWVTKLLRQGRFTSSAVANRLLTEWVQPAQLGAWMAHEVGQHGLSQRYFTSGLHGSRRKRHGFHAASDEARALLDTPAALDARPSCLTWFRPAELENQLAQGVLTLAETVATCWRLRIRPSAAPRPTRLAHPTKWCSTPLCCPGPTSRPTTWNRQYPPRRPRCAACPLSAPASAP
jgi:hypothetical protein